MKDQTVSGPIIISEQTNHFLSLYVYTPAQQLNLVAIWENNPLESVCNRFLAQSPNQR